jgi:hypothetical protein
MERIESIYQEVVKRNPGEVEFHQAVKEVLDSLGPVLVKYPEFTEAKIIRRICEPERQLIFRVPWQDDKGETHYRTKVVALNMQMLDRKPDEQEITAEGEAEF